MPRSIECRKCSRTRQVAEVVCKVGLPLRVDKCEVGTRLEVVTDLLGLAHVRFSELDCNNSIGVDISTVEHFVDALYRVIQAGQGCVCIPEFRAELAPRVRGKSPTNSFALSGGHL